MAGGHGVATARAARRNRPRGHHVGHFAGAGGKAPCGRRAGSQTSRRTRAARRVRSPGAGGPSKTCQRRRCRATTPIPRPPPRFSGGAPAGPGAGVGAVAHHRQRRGGCDHARRRRARRCPGRKPGRRPGRRPSPARSCGGRRKIFRRQPAGRDAPHHRRGHGAFQARNPALLPARNHPHGAGPAMAAADQRRAADHRPPAHGRAATQGRGAGAAAVSRDERLLP